MAWSDRIPVGFPPELLKTANDLAALIDPDERGDLTFSIDHQRSGLIYAEIPFVTDPDYTSIVGGRDAATWRYVVTQLATERNREDIDDETLELLRTSMVFGEAEFAELEQEE